MHPFSTFPSRKRQKTSCFQRVEKGCIGKKWVNQNFKITSFHKQSMIHFSFLYNNEVHET